MPGVNPQKTLHILSRTPLPSENKYAILPAKPVAPATTRILYSGCCSGTGRAYKLKVQVLTISPAANRELLEECQSLKEYMLLMEQVRKYAAFLELNEAVDRAVNKCIQMGSFQTFSQHLLLLDDHFCVVGDQFQKLVDIL